MAPHWKCGSGQPVAGSNPALSATHLRVPMSARHRSHSFWASSGSPWTSRMPAKPAWSWRTQSAIRGGVLLFDTGLRLRQRGARRATTRSRPGRVPDVLADAGIDVGGRRRPSSNCHLHVDHAGQNGLVPGNPHLRPAGRMGDRPHDGAHDPRLDRFPRRRLRTGRRRPRACSRASASSRRPATRSATNRSSWRPHWRDVVLAGQALLHGRRMGRRPGRASRVDRAPRTQTAYDRSIARLQGARSRRGRLRPRPRSLDGDRAARWSRPWLSFRGRARRGTSGALYLQSAIAGLNPLPRSPFSNAARRVTLRTGSRAAANREPCQIRKEAALSDHRRVPRNGLVRAARHGGHEQRPGRRRVHGNNRCPSAQTGERDHDRPAPGPLPPLACPDLRRDRRPGSRRRDASQRRQSRAGQPCRPVRRTARHRQDVPRADPGQGGQLHEPPGRRRLRRVPVLRLDPGGHDPRPDRDRRRQQPWHRRRAQPARAPAVPAGPAPTQGLHPR